MKEITVTLGGQSYPIRALPIKAARAWRNKASAPLMTVANSLGGIQNVLAVELKAGNELAQAAGQIVGAMQEAGALLLKSPDLVFDLLMDYSPELAADRERIEAEAYDEEVVTALVEVIKLAFPLSGVVAAISGRKVK